ncbi:hypothetical protein OG787_12160 [Streptomyces sp. NBC_00075]|uniref:hypothetical protein n=1 Tax=Streptomyces sp. NBC_00075 TaxID=2975641 RepID=UPI0032475FB6
MGWEQSAGDDGEVVASFRRDHVPPDVHPTHPDEAALRADEQLVAMLREDDFDGPMWDVYIGTLLEECRPTVMKWIENGRMFDKAKRAGRPATLPLALRAHLRHDESARHDLALDVMFAAARIFRERALVNGEWSASGRATLRTYYLNMVALQFSNAARTWATSERDREFSSPKDPTDEISQWEADAEATDPYRAADARLDLEALARHADPRIRAMIQLRQRDWKCADIAKELGISPGAAEKAWARFTGQVRAQGTDGRPA